MLGNLLEFVSTIKVLLRVVYKHIKAEVKTIKNGLKVQNNFAYHWNVKPTTNDCSECSRQNKNEIVLDHIS